VKWTVLFHDAFNKEYLELDESIQDCLLAHANLLEQFGSTLGRPTVDTLKGSRHTNMKELRFNVAGEVWRVAFAFDPERSAILLVGGDKAGVKQDKFYKALIEKADRRFDQHLAMVQKRRKK